LPAAARDQHGVHSAGVGRRECGSKRKPSRNWSGGGRTDEEVTQAVTAALTDVQSQFSEVETFLTASQKRADDFAQSAARAVEATGGTSLH